MKQGNFKSNDKVTVTKKKNSWEVSGIHTVWMPCMDSTLGKTFKLISYSEDSGWLLDTIDLIGDNYWYHTDCLISRKQKLKRILKYEM